MIQNISYVSYRTNKLKLFAQLLCFLLAISSCTKETSNSNLDIRKIYLSHYPAIISVSPDESKILLKSHGSNEFSLEIHDRINNVSTTINTDEEGQISPQWGVDGRELAFFLDAGGKQDYKMHIVNLASGVASLLETPRITNPKWAWSSDSRYMAFLKEDRRLMVVDREKSNSVVFETPTLLSGRASFVWNHADNSLAYVLESQNDEIIVKNFETGLNSTLKAPGTILTFCWLKKSAQIITNVVQNENYYIYKVDSESSQKLPVSITGEVSQLFSSKSGDSLIIGERSGFTNKVQILNLKNGTTKLFLGRPMGVGESEETVQIYRTDKNVGTVNSINLTTLKERVLHRQIKGEMDGAFVEELYIKIKQRKIPALLWKGKENNGSVLVMIHGGPHVHYDATWNAELEIFLKNNIDVLLLNYSGSTGFGERYRSEIHNAVEDIGGAVGYLKKQKEYKKIFLKGDSFGSTLALKAMKKNENIVGGIVTNFIKSDLKLDELTLNILAIQGANDYFCPLTCAKSELQHQIADYKKHFFVLESEGHGFRRIDSWAFALEKSIQFINSHVGN